MTVAAAGLRHGADPEARRGVALALLGSVGGLRRQLSERFNELINRVCALFTPSIRKENYAAENHP